jgi:pilus assembly protein CpaB
MIFRMKFIVLAAVILSGLATFGLYSYLRQQKARIAQPRTVTRKVVVASLPIPVGKKLEASDLKVSDWPEAIIPVGSVSNASELIGRVIRTEMQAGEAVMETKLAPKGSEGGFSSIIPPGMRALTVSVNHSSGVSGFILPNARVDVLVTVSSPAQKEESTTKIILEDIKVLAVDQTYERKEDDPVTVQTVTLLVTPEDAEKLVLASTEGKLQLSLRNTSDRSANSTPGVQLKELIAKQDRPAPRKVRREATPANPRIQPNSREKVVEVIRSAQRVEITFENNERKMGKKP